MHLLRTVKNTHPPKSRVKSAAIAGNYCQILRAMAQLKYSKSIVDYKKILQIIKQVTDQTYGDIIKARDLAELTQGMCLLQHMVNAGEIEPQISQINTMKELKTLAQRCALMMPKMTPQSREIVYFSFISLDNFKEPLLVNAFKKY